MTLQEIFDFLNYCSNKEQTGNTFKIPDFNNILKVIDLKFFKNRYGLPEKYQVGQPLTNISYEVTQKITDDLSHLKVIMGDGITPKLSIGSDGYATLPTDYVHPSYLLYTENDESIQIIICNDAEWANIVSSTLKKPTKENPICNFTGNRIRFRPKNIGYVDFAYLRMPIPAFYDYYFSAKLETIYLPPNTTHTLLQGEEGSQGQTSGTVTSLSRELEWKSDMHLDICYFILSLMGINLREGDLIQWSEIKNKNGE